MNIDSDEARIFHLSFVQNPELRHEKKIFIYGPINLRKFIATRPDGTRKPDF